MISVRDRLKRPEAIFLLLAATVGGLFLFITPPFQVSDEPSHLYRAYQAAHFKWRADRLTDGVGGQVPRSLVETAKKFGYITFHPTEKMRTQSLPSEFKRPLSKHDTTNVSFPNTVLYSPAMYAPQALVAGILGFANAPPIVIMYVARISVFLLWLFLSYQAIKITPFGKWAMTALLLNPLAVFEGASLSPDGLLIGLCFFFVALFLKAYVDRKPLMTNKMLLLGGLAVFLALMKPPYFLIALLLVLLPKSNFSSAKRKIGFLATTFLLMILALGAWSRVTHGLFYNYRATLSPIYITAISPPKQISFVEDHPLEFAGFVIATFGGRGGDFSVQTFNGSLGWLDTNLPLWLSVCSFIAMGMALLLTESAALSRRATTALRFGSIAVIGAFATIMATLLYVTWTPVSSKLVEGIQGRYLIPIAVLLVPIFAGIFVKSRDQIDLKKLMLALNTVVLAGSLITVVIRYYF